MEAGRQDHPEAQEEAVRPWVEVEPSVQPEVEEPWERSVVPVVVVQTTWMVAAGRWVVGAGSSSLAPEEGGQPSCTLPEAAAPSEEGVGRLEDQQEGEAAPSPSSGEAQMAAAGPREEEPGLEDQRQPEEVRRLERRTILAVWAR